MCTAISISGSFHFFGRSLDLECSYSEKIVLTPRNFKINFLHEKANSFHYAILGTAYLSGESALYYDAVNEKGLAMAALNFPVSARYFPREEGKVNIASFELISFVLSGAASTTEARELLRGVNITGDSFSPELSATPLHWIVADKKASLIIESVEDGVKIYENPLGVLTNEPPFPFHTARLADFSYLKSAYPENTLSPSYEIDIYSRGMGAVGLPGDYSSSSRFVRAVFLKEHTGCFSEDKAGEASRFFHIMDSLTVPLGAVKTKEGKSVYTVYISMIDTDSLIYYFSTYRSRSIKGVRLSDTPLDSDKLKAFSMEEDGTVFYL